MEVAETHFITRNCWTTHDIKMMQLYGDLSYKELVSACEAVEAGSPEIFTPPYMRETEVTKERAGKGNTFYYSNSHSLYD